MYRLEAVGKGGQTDIHREKIKLKKFMINRPEDIFMISAICGNNSMIFSFSFFFQANGLGKGKNLS